MNVSIYLDIHQDSEGMQKIFFDVKGQNKRSQFSSGHPAKNWLGNIEKKLIGLRSRIKRGGNFDNWDVQVNNGLFAKGRGVSTIEEHGGGKQYLRLKCKSILTPFVFMVTIFLLSFTLWAALDKQWMVNSIFAFLLTISLLRIFYEADSGMNSFNIAFIQSNTKEDTEEIPVLINGKEND